MPGADATTGGSSRLSLDRRGGRGRRVVLVARRLGVYANALRNAFVWDDLPPRRRQSGDQAVGGASAPLRVRSLPGRRRERLLPPAAGADVRARLPAVGTRARGLPPHQRRAARGDRGAALARRRPRARIGDRGARRRRCSSRCIRCTSRPSPTSPDAPIRWRPSFMLARGARLPPRRRARSAAVARAFFLALLAREAALVLPLLLLVLDRVRRDARAGPPSRYLPYLAVAAAYLALRALAWRRSGGGRDRGRPARLPSAHDGAR